MDFDSKYKLSSHLPLLFQDNFSKPRDEFSLEGVFSSKGTSFLQDLHPLENLNLNGSSSSSNPMFPMQPTCVDSFDNSTFGCLPNFDFFETKPFGNHGGNTSSFIPLISNFNHLGHSQMVTPINLTSPISAQSHNPFSLIDLSPTKYPTPDEGSCTTPRNDIMSLSMTTMVKKGGRGGKKKINVVKGQWTIEEDRKWSHIAQLLNGRIGKQCRERWHNHLKPDIKKDLWSEKEDQILIKAHAEIGNKWAEIAKILPGRTENSIKNHWNATKRRQFSRRKCRSKYPRQSSLLQEYIKNLSPKTINAGCRKKNPSSIENNVKLQSNQTGSFDSYSSDRTGAGYNFSEVPDFDFDTRVLDLEESNIDSLLHGASNKDNDNFAPGYDQGKNSFESLKYFHDLGNIMQSEVKREFDLVEMINQVNL